MPKRGPQGKRGSPRLCTLMGGGLDTGLPWQAGPGPQAHHGTAALHAPTGSTVCARWADDGARAPAFIASVAPLSEPKPRALSVRQGEGTHTVAQQGGDGLGAGGHTHPKGETGIARLDHNGSGLAPLPGAPGHAAEPGLVPAGLQALQRGAQRPGWGLKGASLTLAGGCAATSKRQARFKAGMRPHIQETPRHRPRPKRGRPRWGNPAIHA
jgi:hypothetical protein